MQLLECFSVLFCSKFGHPVQSSDNYLSSKILNCESIFIFKSFHSSHGDFFSFFCFLSAYSKILNLCRAGCPNFKHATVTTCRILSSSWCMLGWCPKNSSSRFPSRTYTCIVKYRVRHIGFRSRKQVDKICR